MINDPTTLYLTSLRSTPLLDKDQEKFLAFSITKAPTIEGRELAKKTLIEANLRLVVSVAKKIHKQHSSGPMALLDLIQEGNLGLIKAIDRFKPDLGYRLSTYAVWWIRQEITRSLADKGKDIRIPIYRLGLLAKINRFLEEYYKINGQLPKVSHIAETLEITPKKVVSLLEDNPTVSSLDIPIGDHQDTYIGDMVMDHEAVDPLESYIKNCSTKELRASLSKLKDSERIVLQLRFGLDNAYPLTLKEVGNLLEVTGERVRQIEISALKKLKLNKFSRGLKPLVAV